MKDIILALVTRALFGAHALIAIWRAYTEYSTVTMWLLLVPVGVLILEALFTVGARGGEEYKWLSPCVVLYLASVIPSIWFLEMKNFDRRQGRHFCNDLHWGQLTKPGCNREFYHTQYQTEALDYILSNATLRKEACDSEDRFREDLKKNGNASFLRLQSVTTIANELTTQGEKIDGAVGDVINSFERGKEVLDDLLQNIDIFTETTWVLVLHQLLLFFLIVGRWLLPTGEGISKDQLSQLLLVFIGVGADILEFVTETVKEIEVRCDKVLLIVIMAFWSWSTLQFSLVLTATKARRTRAVGIYEGEDENDSPVVVVEEEDKPGRCVQFIKNMEVWGIFSTLILQDGPFLATRLYIMIGRGVVHQMIVFFTTKNALVVILQFYRLAIIAFHKEKGEEEEEDDFDVSALGALQGAVLGNVSAKASPKEVKKNGGDLTSLPVELPPPSFSEVVEEKETTNSSNNNNRKSRVAFLHVPSDA